MPTENRILRDVHTLPMLRFLTLALLLVTAASCDSGEPELADLRDLSGDPALLAGTWTWTRTVTCTDSGTPCSETTPASAGRAETLTFTHTPETSSHDGTVQGYFNGTAVGPTTYRAVTGVTDFVGFSYASHSLALGEGGGYNMFGVSRDRLVISAAFVDGPETTYRRQR